MVFEISCFWCLQLSDLRNISGQIFECEANLRIQNSSAMTSIFFVHISSPYTHPKEKVAEGSVSYSQVALYISN